MWLYLFWHAPRPGVATALYEQHVVTVHRRLLEAAGMAGLALTAETAHAPGLPWRPLDARARTYEDAYGVAHMGDLERLDRMAVDGAMRAVHDRAASLAADGQGGLYHVLGPTPPDRTALWSTWLAKPDCAPYAEFEAALCADAEGAGGVALRRTMVLSPGPEYLVRSVEPVTRVRAAGAVAVCRRAAVVSAR